MGLGSNAIKSVDGPMCLRTMINHPGTATGHNLATSGMCGGCSERRLRNSECFTSVHAEPLACTPTPSALCRAPGLFCFAASVALSMGGLGDWPCRLQFDRVCLMGTDVTQIV
eukprot:4669933-Amphidinium_carterae.1